MENESYVKSMLSVYGETEESIGFLPTPEKPEYVPPDPAEAAQHPHDGHRGRLRERFSGDGLLNLTDHELLEMLLGFAIPRKDVNPLAHTLIANFGDLKHVMDAKEDSLWDTEGLGEQTIFLLQLTRGIINRYCQQYPVEPKFLTDPDKCREFFTRKFTGMTEECVFAAFFNNRMQLLDSGLQYVGAASAVEAHTDRIIRRAHLCGAERLIIAHNHFRGVQPSLQDLTATMAMLDAFEPAGLRLMDHIVVCKDQMKSMAQSGHLELVLNKRRARDEERQKLKEAGEALKKKTQK